MNKLYKKLRKAFSLMELSICILIVSVIIVVCVPIISNQMKKTDEYSYYLAFKTVDTLGTQIVALGDPDAEGGSWNQKNRAYVDDNVNISRYIANRIDKFTRKHTQKANAETTILSWPSYEYDMARLCNGNQHVIIDYLNLAGNILTPESLLPEGTENTPENIALWHTENCGLYTDDDRLKKRFGCNNPIEGGVRTSIVQGTIDFATTELTAEEFCRQVAKECIDDIYPEYNVTYEYRDIVLNQTSNMAIYGQCVVYLREIANNTSGASGNITLEDNTSFSANTNCDGLGYLNAGGVLQSVCGCNATNPFPSINHPNICCPTPNAGEVAYSRRDGTCTSCRVGAFNEQTGNCCPDNSFYSRTIGHCACQQGYAPTYDGDNELTQCDEIDNVNVGGFTCPEGYHVEDVQVNGTTKPRCVVNPPITRAGRLCELIADNYNISNANCGTFTSHADGDHVVFYNDALYNAITENDSHNYLSSQAVIGAFNNISPNIVFSNGLKLWILGDKVASIAGLSFDPTDYTPNVNACIEHDVYTEEDCDNAGDNHYFCSGTNNCYTLNSGDGPAALRLADARNCCPTTDYEDFMGDYQANSYLAEPRVYAINGFTVFVDITGDKDDTQGGGTMWKDVFPFYVSADGNVYPGYPLNASKTDISLYQGGNSSALSTDVFYFDTTEEDDGVSRKKVMAYTSIPYARALCFSLKVSAYTPYCQNLGQNFRGGGQFDTLDRYIYSGYNPCWEHRCYIHVKNKIKFL